MPFRPGSLTWSNTRTGERTASIGYFGATDPFPPGVPGGGITGIVPLPSRGGVTVIFGSTLGGTIVLFCCDSGLLMSPSAGAIFSGGADAALGGGIGTVGLAGDVAGGVCGW
jgi:hypothetical protein